MSKNRPKLVIFKNHENRSLGNGDSGKKCTRTYGFLFKNGPFRVLGLQKYRFGEKLD